MASLRVSREALLIGAVVVDVLLDLAMFGQGIVAHDDRLRDGALGRAFMMAILGGLAIGTRSRWALWTFVVLDSLTAMMGAFVAFFSPAAGNFRFEPGALVIFLVFGVIAAAAALGGTGLLRTPTRPSPG